MISFLCFMLMLAVFGKLAAVACRAAWGITKIAVCFVTVVFDDTAGCGIGLYRVSDFDYCRDYRFCLIAGLGR